MRVGVIRLLVLVALCLSLFKGGLAKTNFLRVLQDEEQQPNADEPYAGGDMPVDETYSGDASGGGDYANAASAEYSDSGDVQEGSGDVEPDAGDYDGGDYAGEEEEDHSGEEEEDHAPSKAARSHVMMSRAVAKKSNKAAEKFKGGKDKKSKPFPRKPEERGRKPKPSPRKPEERGRKPKPSPRKPEERGRKPKQSLRKPEERKRPAPKKKPEDRGKGKGPDRSKRGGRKPPGSDFALEEEDEFDEVDEERQLEYGSGGDYGGDAGGDYGGDAGSADPAYDESASTDAAYAAGSADYDYSGEPSEEPEEPSEEPEEPSEEPEEPEAAPKPKSAPKPKGAPAPKEKQALKKSPASLVDKVKDIVKKGKTFVKSLGKDKKDKKMPPKKAPKKKPEKKAPKRVPKKKATKKVAPKKPEIKGKKCPRGQKLFKGKCKRAADDAEIGFVAKFIMGLGF